MVDYQRENLPARRDRINPESPEDIAALAKALNISAYHLHKVVTRVGPVLSDIYHALGLRDWEIARINTPQDAQDAADTP